jgi:UDP-GlcNAc:undecaprenyl-phosphate/decaprenyl-phosphate GlcNAc-1-phosphate transferase
MAGGGPLLIPTLLTLLISWTTAFLLTPLIRNFARDRGWVDRPDGRRKLHLTPVPRLGGVAVFAAFALACALIIPLAGLSALPGDVSSSAYFHLLMACALVTAIGVVDDISGVRPATKLVVQALAAVYLYSNGYQITAISNPLTGESVRLGLFSAPLTLIWFVGMSNAFNLIDGLDGLAAGVGLFSTTTLFIACVINERWAIAIIASALAGALLGFLRYNFNPASIFLGDSGALFLGFVLAAVAVRGSMKSSAAIAVAAPLMALAVPILDAGIAVFRRLVRGDDLFQADGDHIHHRLLRMGLTPRRAVAVMYGVAAAFGALSLLTMTSRGQIVGVVIITSSVVTWIGVHQLGYAEFAEIQRSLRYGVNNQRKAMGNNVYLAALAQRFREAPDTEQLGAMLAEAMARLQFQSLEITFEDGAAAPGVIVAFKRLNRRSSELRTQPVCTWHVPVIGEGRILATIVLTRSLNEQAQFDPTHLLNAIQNGFGARLVSMLAVNAAFTTGPSRAGGAHR